MHLKNALTQFGKIEKKFYILVDNLISGRESNFFRLKIQQWIRLNALAKLTRIIKTEKYRYVLGLKFQAGVQFVRGKTYGNNFLM